MKQFLLALIAIQFGVNVLHAQEKFKYEETTWNVIRERLFNGKNTHAFRYEEDIRIQLLGSAQADSTLVISVIEELNDLIEIIDIKFVTDNPNFVLNLSPSNGISQRTNQILAKNIIAETRIMLDIATESDHTKEQQIQYHIFKNLTKTFTPGQNRTGYGGFFDSSRDYYDEIHEIDKDLIRKLYSNSFYNDFKKNTINKFGYLYYLNLRYEGWVKTISTLIAILIIILGFLYLLSKEHNSKSFPTFWNYIQKGSFVIVGVSIAFWFYRLTYLIPGMQFINPFYLFLANIVEVIPVGIIALTLMYYIERPFHEKIANFFEKQIFIFLNTSLCIFITYAIISLPFVYFNSQHSPNPPDYFNHINFLLVYNILIFAGLRVFYNFINYRIQGLVNKKDVELAKMKELKNQAELNALHSRINPHFLYNSLNSIASLAHINADKTENMATGLSELFRYSINKENKTFVSVGEELEMVEKYLDIEKTRFEDRLIYAIDVEENLKETQIPKFLIQPLAENAIKHGLSKIKGVGKITISVKQENKNTVITIFDNGPDFPDEPVSGYGLQNLNDKLEIIYGNDAFINWENGENKHFRITIKNKA